MNNSNDNVLEIKDLHVIYETDRDTVYAVNGLSLAVRRGRTLGLVGETGAGKTTTALSIMRLLPKKIGMITSGTIMLDAGTHDAPNPRSVTELTEADMRLIRGETVSMIFQDPMTSLNPLMTVGNQIRESLEFHAHGRSDAELDKRVDEMLEMVGIPASRGRDYPHQFSGGMQQRVVIALALACQPKLILADEPTTALDVTIQAQVLKMMNELKERLDTSMILITHDLGVVAQTCDDVAIMYAGEIIESGSAEEIYDGAEHHPYTIGLFGSIPDIDSRASRLNPIPGLMPDPSVRITNCPFAPRCPKCTDICREQRPNAVSLGGTHEIKCHLFRPRGAERFKSQTGGEQ